ncbi:hypothetical protein HAV15_010469 [Penicillium sp. str. |nr:hypothetical protein HAV15_010469 [Penicillium sp. str. \
MDQANYPNEPIVVVGSGCRFPGGVNTPSKLWELLKEPRDVQTKIPKERFDVDTFYSPDGTHPGRTNAPFAYLLQEDLRGFDASFFNIQAGEAETIDPQQRLLLETVYEAVSNAGLRIQGLQGSSTAVYVGMMTHDYETIVTRGLDSIPTYSATGVAVSVASNRVSYFFDWHGPSMTIDTACSSSLAAVHLAVQQLRTGESTMAVAAGANLILGPMTFEGVCSIVLKTLSQALRDGDSIECVIRETGINQDGRTTGITMPNHSAQEALIRATYAKAGLDITNPQERCQFFEAHGTGTPAGDPQEAEAIATAFFGHKDGTIDSDGEKDELFVGSIKTVLGHTEGTAGIAGLMKASFAVRNGVIPPNLLFEKISPRVAPFYTHLKIATEATEWPIVAPGQPRRVSVNSFGFGGTNAHAIIEEYMAPPHKPTAVVTEVTSDADACSLPLVLSSKSQRSMKATLENMLQFLETHDDVDMHDIAYTLLEKRSILPFRRAIAAHNKEVARAALEAAIADGEVVTDFRTDANDNPRVLGVFTGQGAQWPGMLKKLMVGMPFVRGILEELDNSLQTLPEKYRPTWTLYDQLMLEGDASNVRLASFSQPLCCAVQIVLVRLLAAAGIEFSAIVGHSSGEIACAFAAGFISATQAIRIAHLRGVVSAEHASSPSGQTGAMLAAGMSYDDAKELCELEAFEGRVCVAASNSPDSVTFSGDMDAIQHVEGVLEDESTFARILRVDKAYHSHHMHPCAAPYVKALLECDCAVADGQGNDSVAWFSAVHETSKQMTVQDVMPAYWKDNLVSPVLFSQAVQKAVITHRLIDVAIEIGAHPALKGPCLATIKDALAGVELPYTGCLARNVDDVDAFAGGLGYIWERFGVRSIDAEGFVQQVRPDRAVQNLSKSLPTYSWDHTRQYWAESRSTRQHLRGGAPHLLLGKLSSYSTASTFQWTNFIRPRDLEWLDGHALQGQTVFPAAGYIIMAMEAAMKVAGERAAQVQLLEILDMSINKAIVFEDENTSVELNLTAEVTSDNDADGQVTVKFVIDSCLAKESELSTSAKGQIVITLGEASPSSQLLPPPEEEYPQMNNVNIDFFYRELDLLGYDYSKDFRRLQTMRRADSKASGTLAFLPLKDELRNEPLLLHPAPLDIAFQTVIGAYSSPGDRRLRSLYVPTHVDRVTLIPSLCISAGNSGETELAFDTINTHDKGDFLSGDITVYDSTKTTLFQVDNIVFKPFSPPTASTDHRIFAKWVWGPLTPEKLLEDPATLIIARDKEDILTIERIVYFYIKSFLAQITPDDRQNADLHSQKYIEWCDQVQADARAGHHQWYQESWEEDTSVHIEQMCESNSSHPHVRLIQRVGKELISIVRGNGDPLDIMNRDGLFTEYYTNKLAFGSAIHVVQDLVSQIAHRYQSIDILEIGLGTGIATKRVLASPQLGFNSYTCTDISADVIGKAREQLSEFDGLMQFEALDINRSPAEQGFKPHSYDLIIASDVLHASSNFEEKLAHIRSLLKPGGHLVTFGVTHREPARLAFISGLFADRWTGEDETRALSASGSVDQWEHTLKRVGFSGVDSRTLDREDDLIPSVFSTHAVDATVERLYDPLSAPLKDSYPPLVVIGGESTKTERILNDMKAALPHRHIHSVKRLESVLDDPALQPKSTFVILSELDDEVFCNLEEDKFEAVKSLLFYAGRMMWLTENAWIDHPHQASTIGMLRTIKLENPDLGTHVFDVDTVENLDTKFFVEQLLRFEESDDQLLESITWTHEPEVYWCKGRAWVPRLKQDIARNDRMNSSRRPIFGNFNSSKTAIALKEARGASSSMYYLESTETCDSLEDARHAGKATVRVRYALPQAIRVGHLGYFHVVQGSILENTCEVPVVALAEKNGSILHVPRNYMHSLPDNMAEGEDSSFLLSTAAALLAETILSSAQSFGSDASILIMEPPIFCVKAILESAKTYGVQVHLATTLSDVKTIPAPWIRLHAKETDARLKHSLPTNMMAFFDLSTDRTAAGITNRLAKLLPPSCFMYSGDYLIRSTASTYKVSHVEDIPILEHSVAMAKNTVSASTVDDTEKVITATQILLPGQLSVNHNDQRFNLATVIDWKENEVSARICPIDSGNLFSNKKTYLLVGLTGDLGRSLCRWMILHGARHVVLTSRNPRLDPKWIANMEALGGDITVLSMDVANEDSVDAGLGKLVDMKLPPVAGIAFGPLVLQDVMLKNMDHQMMDMVLKPKVQGARILHERFSEQTGSKALDFFIMFSSIVAVIGNPGQSNYGAANAYLQALAQQRCARGLAGSTIDIGAVYGVGFVTRAEMEEDFDAIRFMFDSVEEHELHTLFAEAVVSDQRARQQPQRKTVIDMADLELTTGIPDLDPALQDRIIYFNDPRFGNFKIPGQRGDGGDNGSGSKGSIADQLKQATTLDQVRQIVIDGLSEKLRVTLQVSDGESVDPTIPLIDQGVDSLGAVTVGSWFSKQLYLDLPLLRVLGGASVADLADDAATRLPATSIPLLLQIGDSTGTSDSGASPTPTDSHDEASSATSTDASSAEEDEEQEDDNEQGGRKILRRERLSLGQEYSWRQQQMVKDHTIFNNTIGMFMKGTIDLDRLRRALKASLRRHEIFRTCFVTGDDYSSDLNGPVQVVLKNPENRVHFVQVNNAAEAEEEYRKLEKTNYSISTGDTLRLVDFYWGTDDHLLVIGYHRLVGDGSTTENLFNEIGQIYSGVKMQRPSTQFSDLAVQQRENLENGRMGDDIAFWKSMHSKVSSSAPTVLPIMNLINDPAANSEQQQIQPFTWQQYEAIARLDPMVAFRIKERSRKHKATPMQFYLAAYHVLLARLTGSKDITIGLAETNRSTMEEISAMGFFANVLPLRFDEFVGSKTFGEHLVATKDSVREAMQHARVPYGVILDCLGLNLPTSGEEPKTQTHAPLFQAVFDYKQGQAESGSIGNAKMTSVLASRERTPYDIVLEMWDDPTKDPLIHVKLQSSLYGPEHAQAFVDHFSSILTMFSMNPALKLA